jgi:hypothetical protein
MESRKFRLGNNKFKNASNIDALFEASLQFKKPQENPKRSKYNNHSNYNPDNYNKNFTNSYNYYENKYYEEPKKKHPEYTNEYTDEFSNDYYQVEDHYYDQTSQNHYPGKKYHKNYHQNFSYNFQENKEGNINNSSKSNSVKPHHPSQNKRNTSSKIHKDISSIINQKEKFKMHVEKKNCLPPEFTINLINGLIEESMECMICNEFIERSSEIWSCEKCFTIYHNACIYDWIFKLNSTSETQTAIEIYKWTCPHCNYNYTAREESLPIYNCYCRRFYEVQEDKNFNPSLVPHGCGVTCGKEVCVHVSCRLPCHPGPHEPCNITEKINCFCMKTEKDFPCTSNVKKFSCNEICDKVLICTKHKCREKCHEGDCNSYLKNKKCQQCLLESKKKFYSFLKNLEEKIKVECKVDLKTLADNLSEYIFFGTLFCNKHSVEANTDSNLQFLLKLLQISGGKLVDNLKKFVPLCNRKVDNSCDCRSKVSEVECYKLNYPSDILEFLNLTNYRVKLAEKCTKVCKSFKNCKIHRCQRVCCELSNKLIRNFSLDDPEGHHLCLLTCEKPLNCKLHKCENYCHKGNCKSCPNIIREGALLCDCERTRIEAPYQCGSEVNCKLPCNKESSCEHSCKLLCHKGSCPPCEEITFKVCHCKKNVIQKVKCGEKESPLCESPCGEMLTCGVHFCQLLCHEHNEEYDINYFCMMPCGRDLNRCKHKCSKRCHGEEDCNEYECELLIKSFCKCKVNFRNIKCGEFKKLVDNSIEGTFYIPCSEECSKKERVKKIEKAFDDLLKLSEEKNYKFSSKKDDPSSDSINIDVDNKLSKISESKFDQNILTFAKKNIKLIMEIEVMVEKSLKNQQIKNELPKLEKKYFITLTSFLNTYYKIKVDRIKKGDNWYTLIIDDCTEAVLPKYRLSLFGLLFKFNKFITNPKLNIHHPFEMSILIQNYRYSVEMEDLEVYIMGICSLTRNDFYIDEVEKGKCYIHFFNLELGKKLFYNLKSKPSQFQDCYEIYHNLKDDMRLYQLYQYLRDPEYFNLLYYKDEGSHLEEPNIPSSLEDDGPDADGFIIVSKGKKPK